MGTVRLEPVTRMTQAVIHGNTICLAGWVGSPGKSVTSQMQAILSQIADIVACWQRKAALLCNNLARRYGRFK
jgi:hypothetical protein